MNKGIDWHQPESLYRIPVEISNVNQSSPPVTVSLVIPREDLPQSLVESKVDLSLNTSSGEEIGFYGSPSRPGAPLVLWWNAAPVQNSELLLYLRPANTNQTLDHIVFLPNKVSSSPFLLFDGFEDPDLPNWKYAPIWSEEAIFPWMETMTGVSRLLPENGENGYTIELMAKHDPLTSGGATLVVDSEDLAISWGRLDEERFHAQIQSETPSESIITAQTPPQQSVLIRLDIPRASGEPVRFILNGKLLHEITLSKPITTPIRLWLVPRNADGDTYFRWVAVRPYQKDGPLVKLGAIEAQ